VLVCRYVLCFPPRLNIINVNKEQLVEFVMGHSTESFLIIIFSTIEAKSISLRLNVVGPQFSVTSGVKSKSGTVVHIGCQKSAQCVS
jgi:hypothetical protein